MPSANHAFATRLRSLREQAGFSVQQLAEKAGLKRQGLYQLERGESEPTWSTVQKLADALGISTDKFR